MFLIDGLIGLFTYLIVYFLLRMVSVKKIVAVIVAVIAVVAAIMLSEMFSRPIYMQWRYEEHLKAKYPLINFAAVYTPQEFAEFMDKVHENIKSIKDPDQEINYQSELLSTMLLKYGPHASDESLFHYLQASVDYDKKLILIDPVYVLYHEFPEKFENQKMDFSKLDKEEYLKQTFSAVEAVVKSGTEQPRALPTDDEFKKVMMMFRDIVETVSQKYGKELVIATLQNPTDKSLDKLTSANIVIAFFEAVIAKGQADASLFMRVTLELNRMQE